MIDSSHIDEVADGLWVGPYPSTPEFIQALADKVGITASVSVQTDSDLRVLGVNWPLLKQFMERQGIAVTRVPIRDFDTRALERGLDEAVTAVNFACETNKTTYLHCTAGVNRSPSVAIAYLVAHRDMSLDEAWAQVTERRDCSPVHKALKRWYKAHLKK